MVLVEDAFKAVKALKLLAVADGRGGLRVGAEFQQQGLVNALNHLTREADDPFEAVASCEPGHRSRGRY